MVVNPYSSPFVNRHSGGGGGQGNATPGQLDSERRRRASIGSFVSISTTATTSTTPAAVGGCSGGETHVCRYCAANGHKPPHDHDRDHCWRLAVLAPCKYCGAHGYQNHTESHCPKRPRQMLQPKQTPQQGSGAQTPMAQTPRTFAGTPVMRSRMSASAGCYGFREMLGRGGGGDMTPKRL